MSKFSIVKQAAGLIAGISTSIVVQVAVKSYLPVDAKIITKVAFKIGGYALSGVANAAANNYVQKEIQSIADGFQQVKDEVDDTVEAIRADGTVIHKNNN
jgi:hypothetical protein